MPRGAGKTTGLVKLSAQYNVPILVFYKEQSNRIKNIAKELELNIPEPIIFNEKNWFRSQPVFVDDFI